MLAHLMTEKVLLTGRPGCGKTTLIKRVVSNLARRAGGFYTMEIRSLIFRDAVNEALDSKVPLLATIFARPLPFTEAIKSRPDVTLIEVRPDKRERLVSELSDRIRELNPG